MKKIIIAIVILVVIVGGYLLLSNMGGDSDVMESRDGASVGYMDVSAAEAKDLIDQNPEIVIIDVSPHWADGHIPGAINYYPSSALDTAIPTLDKDAVYLVYCHADGPSRNGAQKLADAGLMVYRLEGHYSSWVDAGYDVEM